MQKYFLVALLLILAIPCWGIDLTNFYVLIGGIQRDNMKLVNAALAQKVNLNHQVAATGATPLYLAIRLDRDRIVRRLLELHPDVSIPNNLGETPLHAAATNRNPELCRSLLQRGASMFVANIYGFSPYDIAQYDLATERIFDQVLESQFLQEVERDIANIKKRAAETDIPAAKRPRLPLVLRRLPPLPIPGVARRRVATNMDTCNAHVLP